MNVQPSAQLFYFFKIQPLIQPVVGPFPVLFLPKGLPHFKITNPAHQSLTDGVKFEQRCMPRFKDFFCWCNEVQGLVVSIQYVNYGKPSVLAFLTESELLATISSIGAGANFLDSFERNCMRA